MSDTATAGGDTVAELATNMEPVKALRLLLEVCGDDTHAMIRKHQCPSLLSALDTLTARLAAVERERDAARPIIAAVRHRIDTEAWCIVCGGGLEYTFADDDNPEGLEFRHRDGCALVALDALTADATEGERS